MLVLSQDGEKLVDTAAGTLSYTDCQNKIVFTANNSDLIDLATYRTKEDALRALYNIAWAAQEGCAAYELREVDTDVDH